MTGTHAKDIGTGRRVAGGGRPFYRTSGALLIGINSYQHLARYNLDFAEDDARALAGVLPSLQFPEDHITCLLASEQPLTRGLIEQTLDGLASRMGEEDRLLIFWSGHGVTSELHSERSGHLLLPGSRVESWPSREKPVLRRAPRPALEMSSFLGTIRRTLPAKHKLMLIDTCFSGFMATERGLLDTQRGYTDQWTREPVLQVLKIGRASCRERV